MQITKTKKMAYKLRAGDINGTMSSMKDKTNYGPPTRDRFTYKGKDYSMDKKAKTITGKYGVINQSDKDYSKALAQYDKAWEHHSSKLSKQQKAKDLQDFKDDIAVANVNNENN